MRAPRPTDLDMPTGRRRPALVLLVMLLCGAGFWYNFENRFAAIEARHSLADPATLLLPQERETVLALRAMLRKEWGLSVRIRINAEPDPQQLDSKTVLIHLHTAPEGTMPGPQARVILPPLVDKALASEHRTDKPFSSRLETGLALCATTGTPGKCVEETLIRLLVALGEETPSSPAQSAPLPAPKASPERNGFRAPLAQPSANSTAPNEPSSNATSANAPSPSLKKHTSEGDSHAQSS